MLSEDNTMAVHARILLVDDSKLARMALRAALGDLVADIDMDVKEAPDAETALGLLEHEPFDAVLMDYNMPGMDGLSAATLIRTRFPKTGVALVTANAQDAIVAEAQLIGVPLIPKPVQRRDLQTFLLAS
jgi:Response regulator containing a CheY-like receiver domain and an HTH DNA-binding domain